MNPESYSCPGGVRLEKTTRKAERGGDIAASVKNLNVRYRHPAGFAYHHLAILAVRPDRQGRGLGSALLRAHHAALDRDSIPAYLEASDLRARRLYLTHGYTDCGHLFLPEAVMYPMLRPPQAGQPPGPAISSGHTASTGPGPAPGDAW